MEIRKQTRMRETDNEAWLYLSARLHARETRLAKEEDYRRLLEARDEEEWKRLLNELLGFGGTDFEQALTNFVGEAFALVGAFAPSSDCMAIFRYPYDCHNLKTSIKHLKNRREGSDLSQPPEALIERLGSVDAARLYACVRKESWDLLPSFMAKGAASAIAAYDETGDAGSIDRILDRACFADMEAACQADASGFLPRLLGMMADGVNLLSALRCLRYGGAAHEVPADMLVCGGRISTQALIDASREPDPEAAEQRLFNLLRDTEYAPDVKALLARERISFAEAETILRERRASVVREEMRTALYGVQVAIGYLMAVQTQEINLRLIRSGRRAGRTWEQMRSRLQT